LLKALSTALSTSVLWLSKAVAAVPYACPAVDELTTSAPYMPIASWRPASPPDW
jgi:hypothetical protein